MAPPNAVVAKERSEPMVNAFAPRLIVPAPVRRPTFSLPPRLTVAPLATSSEKSERRLLPTVVSVPAPTRVPPVTPLSPERTRVPEAVLERAPPPTMTPVSVSVEPLPTFMATSFGKVTRPERVRSLVPTKLRLARAMTLPATVRAAPLELSIEPPARVRVPLPRAVALPRLRRPAR